MNISLIYPEPPSADLWFDLNGPLSVAIQAELIHRGYELRNVGTNLYARHLEKTTTHKLNELLNQLLDDESTRRRIPLNSFVRLDAFVGCLK